MLAKFFVNWNYNTVKNAVFSYYEKRGDEIRCIDEELPFEIPDRWEWMQLENCCCKEIRRGKSPKYIEQSETLVFAQKCNTKYNGIDIGLAFYLFAFMKANQSELEKKGEGSTNQKELKPLTLKELYVPVPPYEEQLRIAVSINNAFSLISKLEKSLK